MLRYCKDIIILLALAGTGIMNAAASFPGSGGFLGYSLNIHGGTVLPHHETITYFNREYVRSLELNAWFIPEEMRTDRNTCAGAGYFFSGVGNSEIYGNVHALFFAMITPQKNNLPLQFKVGVGLSYLTNPYDLETNYFNRAIGSHINAYGQFTVKGRIPLLGDKWLIRPALSLHHMSNGAVVAPNQGLNLVTLSAGIEFRGDRPHFLPDWAVRDPFPDGRHRYTFIYAPGIKQVDRRVDRQIFTSSLIFDYGYEIAKGKSVGLGFSLFYNDSWAYRPYIRTERNDELSPFQSALHISLQANRGPLAFMLHPGVYIYNEAEEWPFMTNRIGLKYTFRNNLTLQVAVKSHWLAIADYVEWGIGYEFNR